MLYARSTSGSARLAGISSIPSIPRGKYLLGELSARRDCSTRIADVNCLTSLGDVMDDAGLLDPLG